MKPEDCRANATAQYDQCAICTEHSLTDYKMAPARKATVLYALIVISSVRESAATGVEEFDRTTFMVQGMQVVELADSFQSCQTMCWKLAFAHFEFKFEGTKRDRSAWSDYPQTPVASGKKGRTRSNSPFDASLPGGM